MQRVSPGGAVRYVAAVAAVAALYVLSARWGLSAWVVQDDLRLVWPPAGLALAALLLCGYGVVPGVAAGAFVAAVSAGGTLSAALATAVSSSSEALIGAYLLRRLVRFHNSLDRVHDVLGLLLLAAGASSAIGAAIGAGGLCSSGTVPWSRFATTGMSWWLRDALGVLIVAPVLLTWGAAAQNLWHGRQPGPLRGASSAPWPMRHPAEAAVFFALLALATHAVYGVFVIPEDVDLPLAYAPFALLLWATFRYGSTGSTAATLLVSAVCVAGTAAGRGPFVVPPTAENVCLLVIFLALCTLTSMILSAVLGERDRALGALREARDGLELTLEKRTALLRQTNAELQAEIAERQRAEESTRVQRDLALAFSATSDLADALPLCLATALRAGGLDAGAVHLVDEATGALDLAAHAGLPPELAAEIAHFDPGSPQAQLVLAGEPVYTSHDELVRRLKMNWDHLGLRAVAVIPVCHTSRPIACLNGASHRLDEISPAARAALEAIAAQVGTAIARLKAEADRTRLETAVAQTAEGVVITDAHGRIVYVNPAFERITGYARHEVLSQHTRFLKSGQHDAAFYRDLWGTIASGQTWTGRFVNRRRDGTLYHENAAISPVRDAAGRIAHYVGIKRDVSREVLLEAQLRQSQKLQAVGRLAGGVAHELNNLLTAILGSAEAIAATVPPEHSANTCARRIRKSSDRAADLIRQLLAFSQHRPVEPRILNLNDVVRNAIKLLNPLMGELIRIEMRLDPRAGFVRADAGQLQEALTSLALYAHDAMPGGGTLRIATAVEEVAEARPALPEPVAPGRYMALSVQDSGPGLDAETLARIFEPFFSTELSGPAAGLGLATVYSIVRQSSGRIVAQSAPGQGTTFRIYLPCLARPAETSPAAAVRAGAVSARILLVEDEDDVREIEREILTAEGYAVWCAHDGHAALELGAEADAGFDLLVTDVVMPRLGGRELAEQLLRRGLVSKVLYVSGYAERFPADSEQPEPGTAFLAKPFTRHALIERVRALLAAAPGFENSMPVGTALDPVR